MTDAELIRQSKAGDRDAFGTLIERYAGMVRRVTHAVLGHPEDAEDAAQDAFFSAWSALDRFDARAALGPWLARIAMNAARDLRRRRRVRSTEPLPLAQPAPGTPPDSDAERALLRERLRGALAELPERQRLAVVLFEVEGYSHAEVGAMLGIPEGTARSDVFHARRKLRTILGPEHQGP
ncbi:MAG TPA: sigma-70 family RNA polymerase sigma factor [Gemmatimonadales bacterium]|nr:sigma-70 family RNA polymerase sigma factor [Gemmatimonadales bacterium]